MSISPVIVLSIALVIAGPLVIVSGLDLAARREGRAPRIDPFRIGLGALLDAAGAIGLVTAFL